METLFTFWDIEDARLARTLLEAHNISVVIPDEFMIQANWGLLYAMGGVRLQVPADQAERAAEIFDREREPSAADFAPPRCYACGSDQLEPAGLSRSWALGLLAVLHIPIPFKSGYVCLNCKQAQRGTEEPATQGSAAGLGTPYDPPKFPQTHPPPANSTDNPTDSSAGDDSV